MAEGMIIGRALGKGRQIGHLGERQVFDGLVEIGERRAGDAVGAEAEEDLVEIEFENAVLGVGLLDSEGQDHLLDLPLHGLVRGEQEVLRHLLRDGRSAHRPTAGAEVLHVCDNGTHEAGDVYAGMVVEILVFGREERRLDPVGNGLDRQIKASFMREFAHQSAVGRMDAGRHRRLVSRQHLIVRQVLGEVAYIEGDAGSGRQREDDSDAKEIP
jgi:hypothetical protein